MFFTKCNYNQDFDNLLELCDSYSQTALVMQLLKLQQEGHRGHS